MIMAASNETNCKMNGKKPGAFNFKLQSQSLAVIGRTVPA